MTGDNADRAQPAIFSATLTPHRSLSPSGFLILMACLGGASFATGVVFVVLGAWPVVGFLGLDVLLVYLAFHANYRAAKSYEQVIVTPSELTVRKVTPRGLVREEWTANPRWVRLQQDVHEEFGVERLLLISRGRRVVVAGDLGPDEKLSFAKALSQALFEARRGPTHNP